MSDYKEFFKGKKVTVVGLGLLGKRLGDIIFLAECGADVTVTDLKNEKDLAPSLKKLAKYNKPTKGQVGIKYSLGGHKFEDFENKDFILKGQGVPLDSPYIEHARKNNIPIEMDESLFVKIVKALNLNVKIIGVTGTRGKSTTTILIYEILKKAYLSQKLGIKKLEVFLGGNIKGTAVLPLLKKIKNNDVLVLELSSWQLQGFGEEKISPDISVFTNFMPDHMNYYKNDIQAYFNDKSYIYKFQKENDFLVLGPSMKGLIDSNKSKTLNANIRNVPKNWKLNLLGKHNLENISCAMEVAKILKIPEKIIKDSVENFKAISGRLEFVKEINTVKIYNDTNACTPEATSVALKAIGDQKTNLKSKKIILILGGSDKNLDFSNLLKDIKKYVKAIVLIGGNGTDRIIQDLYKIKVPIYQEKNLKDIVKKSLGLALRGDVILFSPAFTSFGMFKNEYDRGDKFMKIVNGLK